MEDFSKEKIYIFTGSLSLVERKSEKEVLELGHFIKYIDVAYHGEFFEKGKAEFEGGYVNFPYYDLVKEL
jgi:hypothetical protein